MCRLPDLIHTLAYVCLNATPYHISGKSNVMIENILLLIKNKKQKKKPWPNFSMVSVLRNDL